MSIKLEDLIHAVSSECDWEIYAYDGWERVLIYQGEIDKMPMDAYFAVKDLYVLACGERQWPEDAERMFMVDLTADPNSKSMIIERYKARKEREERQKGFEKLNSSKENEK